MSVPNDPRYPQGQQPYGSPPQQGYYPPSGHQPLVYPPGYGAPPPKPKRTALIVGIGALALTLTVVAVLAALGVFRPSETPGASGPESPSASKSGSGTGPKELVETYLQALAAGDAEKAKSVVDIATSADVSALTNGVLQESQKKAKLSDITVEKVSRGGSPVTVEASYKLGEHEVKETYLVDTKIGKLKDPFYKLYLFSTSDVDKKINGATVPAGVTQLLLFPGSYEITTASDYLQFKGGVKFIVKHTSDAPEVNLQLEISQKGIDMFREKVVPAARACVDSKNLDPGCGMAVEAKTKDGSTLTDGTVVRTLSDASRKQLEEVVPRIDYAAPTVIESRDFGYFTLKADCTTSGGATGKCTPTDFDAKGLSWPYARIDVTDPELNVKWEYK